MNEELKKLKKSERKKLIKEIEEGKYTMDESVRLGENRNQLILRIPAVIRKRMKLKKGDRLKLTIETYNRKNKVYLEKENG